MADVNRGNRPLSPFMLGSYYRLQITSVSSLFTRITGIGLLLASLLVVWWFLAAATSPAYFAVVDGLMTSWIGNLVLLGSAFALWYHAANGVRHLAWDAGYGLELKDAEKSGKLVVVAAAVLTVLTVAAV